MVSVDLILVARQLGIAKAHRKLGVYRQVANGRSLVARRAACAAQRIDQRQKLLADVLVGVVGNGVVDKAAAVQAFLRVRRVTHAHRRASGKRQQGAHARKQLAVNHRVQPQAAHGQADFADVTDQRTARTVVQAVHVLGLGELQEFGDFLVFLELQDMNLGLRVLAAQLRKHGAGQHDAAHLGQQDHQDVFGIFGDHGRGLISRSHANPPRHPGAQRLAYPAVNEALCLEFHGFSAFASRRRSLVPSAQSSFLPEQKPVSQANRSLVPSAQSSFLLEQKPVSQARRRLVPSAQSSFLLTQKPVSQTRRCTQRRCFVSAFPGELGLFATEVAVGCGLLVDWAQQVEHLDDAFGAQVKVFCHQS